MLLIYSCTVISVFINLGNSLESTKNQLPSEERYNFFDAELLQVFNQKENTNVLISPISIKFVLGMLMEGAADKTAKEIRAALRLPEDEQAIRREFDTWLSVLQISAEIYHISLTEGDHHLYISDIRRCNPLSAFDDYIAMMTSPFYLLHHHQLKRSPLHMFSRRVSRSNSINESQNTLKIANRMFLSDGYSVNPDYQKILRKYYSGGITSINFEHTKEASLFINAWIGNQTEQFIPRIVEEGQISADNKLMLASAVYFKGLWSSPFSPERSSVRCFYSKNNKCKESLMMRETGYFDYGYISSLDAKAIVLPYKGGKFSMLLLLPSKRDGVELLTRDLMHVSFSSILSELKEQEVFVQIPQFEISYNDDLVESLKRVQIFEVFGQKANLSKMLATSLKAVSVSHIYHSARIVVNEQGTEAAAATGALFVPLMGGTTNSFVANHPFIFFVINSVKNSVLFAGKIVSPPAFEDLQKRTFPSNSHFAAHQKTQHHLQGNLVIPLCSPEGNSAKMNSSVKATKANEFQNNNLYETKQNQQGQQAGPKFRSIKSNFSLARIPSNEREIRPDSPSQLGSSLNRLPNRRTLVSHHAVLLEKDAQGHRKKGKTAQELSKNRKRQEPSSDDWRHHVLFFT